jgi:hypothetical protein
MLEMVKDQVSAVEEAYIVVDLHRTDYEGSYYPFPVLGRRLLLLL